MEQEKVKVMPPQKTWFFEDSEGRTFETNEKEAFNLLTSTSKWRRQDIQMIGMSDGTTYHKYIQDNKKLTDELSEKIKTIKEKLDRYVEGHDALLFKEFAEEDDPRVIRAKKKIEETEAELEPLNKELKELKENIIKKAIDAEREVARGNMTLPRDFSVIDMTGGDKKHQQFMENFKASKRVI